MRGDDVRHPFNLGTPELPVLGGLLIGVAPTGRQFTVQSIHFYRVVGDEIVEHRAVRDDLGIMQQLGLSNRRIRPAVTFLARLWNAELQGINQSLTRELRGLPMMGDAGTLRLAPYSAAGDTNLSP